MRLRRQVAQMLAQGRSETEIAQILHVHVSTISRDVKVLKELSQRFVFDLAILICDYCEY
ncbi:MAG: helix-turn-helix domain-containing protein [Nitrososphaeraceae archaeon]